MTSLCVARPLLVKNVVTNATVEELTGSRFNKISMTMKYIKDPKV